MRPTRGHDSGPARTRMAGRGRLIMAIGSVGFVLLASCTTSTDGESDRGRNPVAEEAAASPIVPEDQLVDGGSGLDGIPPIDDPRFVSPDAASSFLDEREPVIALEIDDDARTFGWLVVGRRSVGRWGVLRTA